MKLPVPPPDHEKLFGDIIASHRAQQLVEALLRLQAGPAPGGKYRHWDEFRHVPSRDGLTPEQRWLAVKLARRALYKTLAFLDTEGRPFRYAVPDLVLSRLHRVDRDAAGTIRAPELVTSAATRDSYLLRSVAEEAITSSQLEGASTTRRVAKAMLLEGRAPRNRSEQMIANNYTAMLWVRQRTKEPLTPDIVRELQSRIVTDALDDPSAAGRYRRADEIIHVSDEAGHTLHVPPQARELDQRVQVMCDFANADSSSESADFIHPVIRAILLHFWLAYDHPFVDGNGRTARALFYWSMARQGYWLCEYLSISRILRKAPAAYARAFLFTESDENDTTYFIIHQLRVLLQAIDALHEFLAEHSRRIDRTATELRRWRLWRDQLNPRQLHLLEHALEHPDARYTIDAHQRAHGVAYQSARNDLLSLATLGLLEKGKLGKGRAFAFQPSRKLREKIETTRSN